MNLCFATNNVNKIRELKQLLGERFKVLSLEDIGCREELPENQDTLEGNALEKAEYVFKNYNVNCFADDSGLEVFSLNGEPGVYSARYAGSQKNNEENINLLLKKLESQTEKSAQFRTVIALIIDGKKKIFEGIVKGRIIDEKRGVDGFGYDPVFIPDNYNLTFAEMNLEEKNKISHRSQAVTELIHYLASNK